MERNYLNLKVPKLLPVFQQDHDQSEKAQVLYALRNPIFIRSDGVVRLSISPSQGDDPGFKSRSEH